MILVLWLCGLGIQLMINVLSVDVEDYFHVEAFASRIQSSSWDTFEPRVDRNISHLLDLFKKHGVNGTFFFLGWVAERCPGLVRRVAQAGHEIGCHGFAHRRLQNLTPEEFRQELRAARLRLMDEAQQPIVAHRAPSFSIVKGSTWAFDVLAEEGFLLDSSVFPVKHDIYGMPDAERFPHWESTSQGKMIFEFPPSTVRRFGNNLGVGGGGYLRLLPYSLTRWALRHINESEGQPAMVYLHPWEIDPDQPRIAAGLRSHLRHYTNLRKMEGRIGRLLRDFRFDTLSNVCNQLEAYKSKSREMTAASG